MQNDKRRNGLTHARVSFDQSEKGVGCCVGGGGGGGVLTEKIPSFLFILWLEMIFLFQLVANLKSQ